MVVFYLVRLVFFENEEIRLDVFLMIKKKECALIKH